MTRKQQAWAAQHDWFRRTIGDAVCVMEISVREAYVSIGGVYFPQAVIERGIIFSDFKELREWAGY